MSAAPAIGGQRRREPSAAPRSACPSARGSGNAAQRSSSSREQRCSAEPARTDIQRRVVDAHPGPRARAARPRACGRSCGQAARAACSRSCSCRRAVAALKPAGSAASATSSTSRHVGEQGLQVRRERRPAAQRRRPAAEIAQRPPRAAAAARRDSAHRSRRRRRAPRRGRRRDRGRRAAPPARAPRPAAAPRRARRRTRSRRAARARRQRLLAVARRSRGARLDQRGDLGVGLGAHGSDARLRVLRHPRDQRVDGHRLRSVRHAAAQQDHHRDDETQDDHRLGNRDHDDRRRREFGLLGQARRDGRARSGPAPTRWRAR